jgi:exodeoxyribonuclease-3
MKIATWNVNSMKVRLPHVLEWLDANNPDVLVLQEIKQVTEAFPAEALAEVGYASIANGPWIRSSSFRISMTRNGACLQ